VRIKEYELKKGGFWNMKTKELAHKWIVNLSILLVIVSFCFLSVGLANAGTHTLIADSENYRVIEVDSNGKIVWEHKPPIDFFFYPFGVQRLPNGNTLVACSNDESGVKEIDPEGNIVWEYFNSNFPDGYHCAERLSNGNTLITTNYPGHKVIEVDKSGKVVWEYYSWDPETAYRLPNGNTLIAGGNGNYVEEVDKDGTTVWSFSGGLNYPTEAQRLSNGNTLIADMMNYRVIEVDKSGDRVWGCSFASSKGRCEYADRLSNGNTLITIFNQNKVIEVDKSCNVVWEYSTGLNYPRDAVRVMPTIEVTHIPLPVASTPIVAPTMPPVMQTQPPVTPMPTPAPTPPSLPISQEYLYVIPIALLLLLFPFIFYIKGKRKKPSTTPETPPEQKPIIIKEMPPPISKSILIERAIYDPCKQDFVERALPRMKEWINRYDPGAYWFAISIQNNTAKPIEEWGVELETSSALKINEAKIEGIEIEIPHEAHLGLFKISVPKEYGIVIPKGGAQRVFFKLRAAKPKTTYEISGIFKNELTGDVPIRTKQLTYLCDTGVSPEAVKMELKKTFSEKDAARLANTFRVVQEIRSGYCSTDTTAREINKEFDLLKMYFTEKDFLAEIDNIQRRLNAELREDERLDDKHVEAVNAFCEKFTEMWIAMFLR
jgi:DNA-binding beta-propeller fold protein YncE